MCAMMILLVVLLFLMMMMDDGAAVAVCCHVEFRVRHDDFVGGAFLRHDDDG